jgi:glycosyltransferase involved in cell wall biosynthesis
VPVVAAAVGGLTTLVSEGRTGYLVEPDDADAFAKRVAEIVTDPMLQGVLGAAGASMARSYTWATAAGRLRALYAELTSRELVEC